MAKVSTFFGAHPPTAAEMGRIYSGWISVEFWAPGRWRSLLGNLQGFAWKVRGGYSLLGTWTILFGLGSLSGPRHCSDRGPEAWASPSARTARAGWYQVHLVRLGTDVLLGIRWLPRGRGGSWVVPAPSAHAEGRVGSPPPPFPLSPPVRVPSPADPEWSMRFPSSRPRVRSNQGKMPSSFPLVRPATPVRKQFYYDDDPQPRCKYRFVPDPLPACIDWERGLASLGTLPCNTGNAALPHWERCLVFLGT